MQSDGIATSYAIPGPAEPYSTGPLLVGSGATVGINQDPNVGPLTFAGQRMTIPPDQKLRAISIAADSCIHTCDIAIGGRYSDGYRTRVSPGNPLIGNFEGFDHALITLPLSVPIISAFPGLNNTYAHDAVPIQIQNTNYEWAFPLRLELWYGDLLPIRSHLRAPGFAMARLHLPAAGNSFTFYVMTEGRKRVAVDVVPSSANTSIAINGISSRRGIVSGTFRQDQAFFGASLASGAITANPTRFGIISGDNPWPMIAIQLTDSVGNTVDTAHQVNVSMWDD
jgi:hypothetical protein